jgi:hypothetical protein
LRRFRFAKPVSKGETVSVSIQARRAQSQNAAGRDHAAAGRKTFARLMGLAILLAALAIVAAYLASVVATGLI